MNGALMRCLAARWAARLRRHIAPSTSGENSAGTDTQAVPRRIVLVTTYDAGIRQCAAWRCGEIAELLISIRPAAARPGLWPSCVDHWVSVRSVFVGSGDRIDYGPGAPGRIIQRAVIASKPS